MPDARSSIARYYHERTKYDPETLSRKARSLDWSQQPEPYKDYEKGVLWELLPYLTTDAHVFEGDPSGSAWQRISRLLYCSYGLTAKILTTDRPMYLRAAPSAGGLYPAEIYLLSRGTPQIPPGIYNYQAKTHALSRFREEDPWPELQEACFWYPILESVRLTIAVTAVFFRSAWRYEDRAYRRVFLDSGHLLGNLELSGAIADYRPHAIGGFADEAIARLLQFDPREEGAIAILPLADRLDPQQHLPSISTTLGSRTDTTYPELQDGELLGYLHRATQIDTAPADLSWRDLPPTEERPDKYNFPFCTKVNTHTSPIHWEDNLDGLERTLMRRRSTRRYSGADLTLDELRALLDFTYHPENYIAQGLDGYPDYFDLSLVETFLAVSGASGLDEGCYYYAPKARELRQIRFKNFRQDLHFLCLGQDLGRDASVLAFHTADLEKAIAKYGDRAYRYLHADAGHLGQRLNLAAIRLGLGASGIAGFFDDRVNDLLGIPPEEAVLYITTLGRPR